MSLQNSATPVLSICNLKVELPIPSGVLTAVKGLDLDLLPGETLGIVGESGSGKSMTAHSIMGLLPKTASWSVDRLDLCGQNLIGLSDKIMARDIRGRKIGMIFQEPMTSLNPVYPVGRQLMETMQLHGGSKKQARERALELMQAVGFPDPEARFNQYPHQFSGGQRQRLMIAAALMNEPELLIADEPTTALDVTIQAQILGLLKDLQKRLGIAMILISHDFGVIAEYTDKVLVMLKGDVVEAGETQNVLSSPQHEYTTSLLDSIIHPVTRQAVEIGTSSYISVEGVSKTFSVRKGLLRGNHQVKAVQNISLEVCKGETLAIVGESGSGKSTLSKLMLGLLEPDQGRIRYNSVEINDLPVAERARLVQPIFQDPYSSLNPRRSVREIIRRPLDIHRVGTPEQREEQVRTVMERTGLTARFLHAFPNQMSGGQRQRVAIARALVLKPEILICDEPTSALDVSIQAQVLELLEELKSTLGLTIVMVTHDLGVVEQISDRVVVMKEGRIVEHGPTAQIYKHPQEPYTRELLAAIPRLDAIKARGILRNTTGETSVLV